jgi:two-component system, LytTR family, sensor kinase
MKKFWQPWWKIPTSAVIGLLVYLYLYYSETGHLPASEAAGATAMAMVLGIAMGAALQGVSLLLDKVYPWQDDVSGRLATNLLAYACTVLTLLLAASYLAQKEVFMPSGIQAILLASGGAFIKLLILAMVVVFFYTAAEFLLHTYRLMAAAEIGSVQLTRTRISLQLEALRSQLTPHYLFNNLNTLSALLYKDSQQAELFVRKLAQTYRYVLSQQEMNLVPLRQEAEFARAYHYLLQMRYGKAIHLYINIPENDTALIPPLTLQLLLENAVKHNTISDEQPLYIEIRKEEDNYISVSNNLTGAMPHAASLQIGQNNIRKRYQYFTKRPVQISQDERYTVLLPLLRQEMGAPVHFA